MGGMWSLGGLSLRELLKRTARESWEDDVFGQSARLAFYHFIAIFPALLLLLIPLAHLAETGTAMRQVLSEAFREFLPQGAAALVTGAIGDLEANARARGALLIFAAASAIWAALNGSWAMIRGLNTAYETAEDRKWWEIGKAAAGLSLAVLALIFAALLAARFFGGPLAPGAPHGALLALARWCGIAAILLIAFTLFYRFGPNLKRRRWQWSTPGAVFGALLWVAGTLAVREYFDRFATYQRTYGRAAAAAMLLMWLYMTGATVLLGAEMNSEIEKAREKQGAERPERELRPQRRRT